MGPPERGPLVAPVINQFLKLRLGGPLGLLGPSLEHHDLVLLRGVHLQLLLERLFDALVDFNVAASY